MKKHRVILYGLLFITLLVMTTGNGYAADKTETIKIGLILDLTGPIGPGGIDMQKGINLAREKLGDTVAGKKIEFIIEDNGSDAGMSMDKAKKLVETDKVAMIYGPINGGGQVAVAQYLERVHVPGVNAMMIPRDAVSHSWSVASVGIQVQVAYGPGVYAADALHYKTAVALAADFVPGHDFIEGFKMGFEGNGGKIIQETYYPEGTSNVVPFLTALKQADVFMYWGTPGDCFAMYPQYKELNLKMPILMPEDGGVMASPGMLKNLGKAAVGVVFGTAYLYNANIPGNKEFVDAYQKKYNELPGVMSGVGYANMQLVWTALKANGGNTKPDALLKALKVVSADTVRGHLSFSPGQGGQGNIANWPNLMGKISPDFEIVPILPVQNIQVKVTDGKYLPYVAK